MANNEYDPNLMQKLYEMYKNGQIPNMPPNAMAMGNPNQPMGNPNQQMGNLNQPMGNPNQPMQPMGGAMPYPQPVAMGNFQSQMPYPQPVGMDNPQQPMGVDQQMPMGNPQQPMGNPQAMNYMSPGMPMGGMWPYPNYPMPVGPYPPFPQPQPQPQPQPKPESQPQPQNEQPKPTAENWTLIFESKEDGQRINVQIPNDKTLQEACNHYRMKSGKNEPKKFVSGGKPLNTNLILNQSGLSNNSIIMVEPANSFPQKSEPTFSMPAQGGKLNLIFELKAGGQTMTVQVTPDKKVSDAINSYKNKIQMPGEMKFIFNGQNLNMDLTLKAAGLKNGSKILVITTKDIEGA